MRRLLVTFAVVVATIGLAPSANADFPVMSWVTTPGELVTSTDPVVFDWEATGATITWFNLYRKNAQGEYQSFSSAFPYPTALTLNSPGDGEFRLDVYGNDGNANISSLTYYFEIDAVAEAETIVPQVTADGAVIATVESTPSAAGNALESYDVRTIGYTWMSPGGGGAVYEYPEAWQATSSTEFTVTKPPRGQFVCFSARAREVGGATGPWSLPNCSSTALDDRQFTKLTNANGSETNDKWVRGTGDAYTFGRFTRTSVRGHVATTDRIVPWYQQPVLIATTCPACGRVSVRLAASDHAEDLGTYSLVSDARIDQALIPVDASLGGGADFGRLKVTVASRDKLVLLDGFAVLPPESFR